MMGEDDSAAQLAAEKSSVVCRQEARPSLHAQTRNATPVSHSVTTLAA